LRWPDGLKSKSHLDRNWQRLGPLTRRESTSANDAAAAISFPLVPAH
jgi:hypothetical protein